MKYPFQFFYKNSLDVFDVMKLQLRINNCTYYISSWINKHDCSFTQKISSTFLFLIFHKIELSLHSNFLITSRDATNNENVSSQTISTDIVYQA